MDLDVSPGEFVMVIGQSGAGKSSKVELNIKAAEEAYQRTKIYEAKEPVSP